MSANQYSVVVLGSERIAELLKLTGQFADVIYAPKTSDLKNMVSSGSISTSASDKVFVFSDTTEVDVQPGLDVLIQVLISRLQAKVVIVGFTPLGSRLANAAPSAGLIEGSAKLNTLLGGIASLQGMQGLHPVSEEMNYPLREEEPVVQTVPTTANPFASDPFSSQPAAFQSPAQPTAPVMQPPRPRQNVPFGAPSDLSQPTEQLQGSGNGSYGVPSRRGFVIATVSPKGGVGKSSFTTNMAAYLGLKLRGTGKNVCIVDANIQQADAGKYLHVYSPNAEDLFSAITSVNAGNISKYLAHKPELNLSALLGPTTPEVANPVNFSAKHYSRILGYLKQNYDYIVIDTPVAEYYHPMFQNFVLPNADFLTVLVEPNMATLHNAYLWMQQITSPDQARGVSVDSNKIGVVLNKAADNVGCTEDTVRTNLSAWRYFGSLPDIAEWKRANNESKLVVTENYDEINSAFSDILYKVTGEMVFQEDSFNTGIKDRPGGFFSKIFGTKKKKG